MSIEDAKNSFEEEIRIDGDGLATSLIDHPLIVDEICSNVAPKKYIHLVV